MEAKQPNFADLGDPHLESVVRLLWDRLGACERAIKERKKDNALARQALIAAKPMVKQMARMGSKLYG